MTGTDCGHAAAVEEGMAEPLFPVAASVEEAEHGGLPAAAAAARAARAARPGASRGGRVLGLAAALCAACAVALLARAQARPRHAAGAAAGEATGLFLFGALASAAEAMLTGAKAAKAVSGGISDFNGIMNNENLSEEISKLEQRFKLGYNKTTVNDPHWRKFLPNATENLSQEKLREMLFPHVHRHDGNLCYDDEEEHAGLCYPQCSLLTFGTHPYRTSAFSCCSRAPCQWDQTAFRSSICGGFDVSGDSANGICPHLPGACLANEELLNGLCYKKCSILTEGEYMFRTGPLTCCKFRSQLACTAGAKGPGGSYDISSPRFATGGGLCTSEMPCMIHPPSRAMAENAVWEPWDNFTDELDNLTDELEGSTTEEEAASRLLDGSTAIGEAEAEVAPTGSAPASATDNAAAAIAAEEEAIAAVEEAVKAAKEAAAAAKAQAARSAAQPGSGRGGTESEGAASTEAPSVEAAAMK
ncbi:unnamed protein product [Prorocentrum cordatum]|uniref:Uncharacterized protein n=1 Tax=Prorocentrum cordatum TaxID=2364126 RepID=A0ABN9X6U9_9DINO|nr:unnamed protein product [Polarella glacialis]